MRLTAREVAAGDGRGRGRRSGTTFDSFSNDSRALEPGACFVALSDSRDGHDFVGAAFSAGAAERS